MKGFVPQIKQSVLPKPMQCSANHLLVLVNKLPLDPNYPCRMCKQVRNVRHFPAWHCSFCQLEICIYCTRNIEPVQPQGSLHENGGIPMTIENFLSRPQSDNVYYCDACNHTETTNKEETVIFFASLFKFSDGNKKQERNIMVTTAGVYNLKKKTIRKKIDIDKIKAIMISAIGNEFVLHVPDQSDCRYESEDHDRIIYSILKAYTAVCKEKMPIYVLEELSLVDVTNTRKKRRIKALPSKPQMHDDKSYQRCMRDLEEENETVRKTTKILFAKDSKETAGLADFAPRRVLGKGAFGTVLLVEKKNTGELFAMKSIKKQEVVKKDQLEHTRTEKLVLQHINHPYLVNLAYSFQTPTKLYFIMQFMKGGCLYQQLSKAKIFPQQQAKFYAMQIALGIGHLHSEGILYRDLKLQNVLMDEHGNVCLSDFGMAKILKEGQSASTFCGTPEYLAPEVLDGCWYGRPADWWSLGTLTYQIMFGQPPFYSRSQSEMFKKIRQAALVFSEKVPLSNEGKDFITRMLVKNPDERLGSKSDMDEILSHPWFQELSVEKMMKKELPTPFKPKVEGEDWLDNFDKNLASEEPVIEEFNVKKQSQYKGLFDDF